MQSGRISKNVLISHLRDKNWLEEHYVKKQQSAASIAKDLKTDTSTVLYYVKKHGFKKREAGEAQILRKRTPRKYGSTLYNEIWLKDQYEVQGKTATQIT